MPLRYAHTALKNGQRVKVVTDTNIIISGYLWRGAPNRVLNAAKNGQVTLVTSAVLLAELADVLQRPKFTTVFQRNNTSASALLAEYTALTTLVTPAPLPAPICDDPDDDAVIACALAANAAVIATGDDDLLRLGSYGLIQMLTVGELLYRLEATTRP